MAKRKKARPAKKKARKPVRKPAKKAKPKRRPAKKVKHAKKPVKKVKRPVKKTKPKPTKKTVKQTRKPSAPEYHTIKVQNYINGEWVDSISGRSFNSYNPAIKTEVIATCPRSDVRDVDAAVAAAKKAFKTWRLVPAPKRAEILLKAVELLKEHREELAILSTREMGKVMPESIGDVQEAIDLGLFMVGEGRRMHGQTMPSELAEKNIRTIRQPVGVFALITPWNFPFAIPSWKIFPCLVTGNTAVFKASQYTAACGAKLIQIFEKAGVPPGVLNLINGFGSEAGDALVRHTGIDGVSFTGSTMVGRIVGNICGAQFKNHALEMGGKNCVIVLDDANLELAAEGAVWAGFGTSGQRCTAGSRVIIHDKIYDKFKKKFMDKVRKLRLGNGLDPHTHLGPLVNEEQLRKVERMMELARTKDKAKFLIGGKSATEGKLRLGHYFEPTVLEHVTPNMICAQQEIFGPVVSLMRVHSFNEAIKVANNIDYGLSASIFTQDINKANRAARDLETGIVYINTATIGAEIQAPFGGRKNTGNGHREAGGIGGALSTYTEIKTINTDYSGKIQKAQNIEWGD